MVISITVGARAYCRTHGCPWCAGALDPIPGFRLSVFRDADPRNGPRDFTKATIQVEDSRFPGGVQEVTVGSLSDIRRLERESEQRERDGFGRRTIWRDYAQDRSNIDVHTLGTDPSLRPSKTFTNGQPVVTRKGDPVIADHGTVED